MLCHFLDFFLNSEKESGGNVYQSCSKRLNREVNSSDIVVSTSNRRLDKYKSIKYNEVEWYDPTDAMMILNLIN